MEANTNTAVMAFGDGAVLLYDQAAHLLKGTLPATGRMEITAPGGFTFTGNVDIDGQLSVSRAATFDQTVHARQDVTSDADVKAGSISLTNHPHGGVKGGTEISGKPLP